MSLVGVGRFHRRQSILSHTFLMVWFVDLFEMESSCLAMNESKWRKRNESIYPPDKNGWPIRNKLNFNQKKRKIPKRKIQQKTEE